MGGFSEILNPGGSGGVTTSGGSGTAGTLPVFVSATEIADSKLSYSSNVLSLINSTSAQILDVYNTFTSSTNNEKGRFGFVSNVLRVGTIKGSGGGTARSLALITDDTARTTISTTAITNTLPLLGPDGSGAGPTYSFSSDPDTGLVWSGSPDIVVMVTGAQNRQHWASDFVKIYGARLRLDNYGTTASVSYGFDAANTEGLWYDADWGPIAASANADSVAFTTDGPVIGSTKALRWANTDSFASATSTELALYKDAANVLAQRRGANAQAFRVYNTYTSSTNNELGKLEWASNTFRIGTEKGSGGGTARSLALITDDTDRVTISTTALTSTLPILGPDGSTSNLAFSFASDPNTGIYRVSEGAIGFGADGQLPMIVSWTGTGRFTSFPGAMLSSAGSFQWDDGSGNFTAAGLALHRDANHILAQRHGTNAQEFRVYNTYTSATNYELGKLEWASNVCRIGTEKGSGGGTARSLALVTDDTDRVTISTTAVTSTLPLVVATANGALGGFQAISESITLSTSGATTDSSADLLPANAEILGVTFRITTSITGVDSTALQFGDPTTATRFGSTATLTSGTTGILQSHRQGSVASDATGPVQTAAAKLRLTLAGGGDNTPSGGVVRVTVTYWSYTAPTS